MGENRDSNKMPRAANSGEPDEALAAYRLHLVAAEQKAQEDFDKTILSLSGGALGVSFVFLKDIIGPEHVAVPFWLFAAWLGWGLSTTAILSSYFLSHLALRRAIKQVDDGTIYLQKPGGAFSAWTAGLNLAGAGCFLLGVVTMSVFVSLNLPSKGAHDARTEDTAQATAGATAAAATLREGKAGTHNGGVRPAPTATAAPASK